MYVDFVKAHAQDITELVKTTHLNADQIIQLMQLRDLESIREALVEVESHLDCCVEYSLDEFCEDLGDRASTRVRELVLEAPHHAKNRYRLLAKLPTDRELQAINAVIKRYMKPEAEDRRKSEAGDSHIAWDLEWLQAFMKRQTQALNT